jgi:hypothetical protein
MVSPQGCLVKIHDKKWLLYFNQSLLAFDKDQRPEPWYNRYDGTVGQPSSKGWPKGPPPEVGYRFIQHFGFHHSESHATAYRDNFVASVFVEMTAAVQCST